MSKNSEAKIVSRKEWSAPKLKKIGIENLTEYGGALNSDGRHHS